MSTVTRRRGTAAPGLIYTGASAGNTNRDTGGTVFSVPYTYTKESAATARQRSLDCSGPQPIR